MDAAPPAAGSTASLPESVTVHRADPAPRTARHSARDRRRRRLRVGAWLPAGLVTVLIGAALVSHDVSVRDLASFAGYLVVGVTVPGVLVLRALLGGRRTLAEELAAGTALGYAVE
ncbi:hypothetical protein ACFOSO_16635, partial [Planomonospora venezuelensis]